ncbi:hypothetical protein KKH82_05830 [Patescibacteria group bacterium]|nr:hypothetical protein [Patescibacteria group bacterium]
MKYIDVLKEREVTNHCPLCEEKKSYMLQRGKYCYVTTPRAPYTSDHILIAPIRHVVFLHDLSPSELKEFYEFVSIRTEKIHTYHKELILLCKDGLV